MYFFTLSFHLKTNLLLLLSDTSFPQHAPLTTVPYYMSKYLIQISVLTGEYSSLTRSLLSWMHPLLSSSFQVILCSCLSQHWLISLSISLCLRSTVPKYFMFFTSSTFLLSYCWRSHLIRHTVLKSTNSSYFLSKTVTLLVQTFFFSFLLVLYIHYIINSPLPEVPFYSTSNII